MFTYTYSRRKKYKFKIITPSHDDYSIQEVFYYTGVDIYQTRFDTYFEKILYELTRFENACNNILESAETAKNGSDVDNTTITKLVDRYNSAARGVNYRLIFIQCCNSTAKKSLCLCLNFTSILNYKSVAY